MPLGRTIPGFDGRPDSYECSHCGYIHATADAARQCCVYRCEDCGSEHRYVEDADACCMYECGECGAMHETDEQADACCEHVRIEREERRQRFDYPNEIIQQDPGYWITIPELPNRPSRLCSIEQELSKGGHRVARMLYDMGMSHYHEITNYSADAEAGMAVVKQDATLDRHHGGEVLYSRLNLSSRTSASAFSRAIWFIRELKKRGLVTTSRNAGTHIHISAISGSGIVFGPAEMAKLYEIFSFCEDVLFRLSAAGWAGHRGTQHTLLIDNKEDTKTEGMTKPGKLAKYAMRDRHFALNFRRLMDAARACTCGAGVVGDWAECECGRMRAGTVEWRIFNATTKPETMHGWLILAHALTAKAFDYQLGELHPNGFNRTAQETQGWILGWIMNECPMTHEEKRVILDLARRSPGLDLDWDVLAEEVGLMSLTDDHGDDDQFQVMSR